MLQDHAPVGEANAKCRKNKQPALDIDASSGKAAAAASHSSATKKPYKGPALCQHQRRRSRCKDCGGSGLCEHQRQRSQCKQCGGSSICEHQRVKSRCKDCGGSGICKHGREWSRCKDCGGSGLCKHGRRRSRCKDCCTAKDSIVERVVDTVAASGKAAVPPAPHFVQTRSPTRVQPFVSTSGGGAGAKTADEVASASTSGRGASANNASAAASASSNG